MSELVPPVPKMPNGRLVRMVSVSFVLEILQTICSMLVVFAPVLVCLFAKYWVQGNWIQSETAGDLACFVAGSGIDASYFVGVGVGIFLLGWLLSIGVSILSFLVMFIWFTYAGIGFMDRAGLKLFIYMGSLVLESVPFVSVLPWSTAGVYMIARQVQKEDREALGQYEASVARAEADALRQEQQLALIAKNDNAPEEMRAA